MIDFIDGQVEYIESDAVVIATSQGIGYRTFFPNPYSQKLKQAVRVYTHHHVRDDAISLYGFGTRTERDLFRKLIEVSGIGPKGALTIIASAEPVQIVAAVQREDVVFLTKFPGIGKKTAGRMIIDLKDKLNEFLNKGALADQWDGQEEGLFKPLEESNATAISEASEALKALGYSDVEVQKVMGKLKGEEATTEQLIKKALQLFISSK